MMFKVLVFQLVINRYQYHYNIQKLHCTILLRCFVLYWVLRAELLAITTGTTEPRISCNFIDRTLDDWTINKCCLLSVLRQIKEESHYSLIISSNLISLQCSFSACFQLF